MFETDFLAVLLTWHWQRERVTILWDANMNVLDRPFCRPIMEALDMVEVLHQYGEAKEPSTHIRGSKWIDGCMHTKDLDALAALLKSFHNSCGDHRTRMVDFTTQQSWAKLTSKKSDPSLPSLHKTQEECHEVLTHF